MFGSCVGFGPAGVRMLRVGRSDASMTDALLYPPVGCAVCGRTSLDQCIAGDSLAHVGEHTPGTPASSGDAHARIYSVI